MTFRDKLRLSLQARFSLAIQLSVVSIVIIALILLWSFVQVRSDIRQVVGSQLQQTTDNLRLARELGQFIARLKFLEATFYRDDDYLQQEGAGLKQLMARHRHASTDALLTLHLPMQQKLDEYLAQCNKVNELLLWIGWEEQGLDEVFVILEELVAEQGGESTLSADEVDYYEQLNLLIASSRIALFEIIQRKEQESYRELFSAAFFDPPPNSAQISDLMLKLDSLSAAPPPINRFGRHLIDQLKYYQHLASRFQQEMIHLGHRSAEMNQLAENVLERMLELDRQHIVVAKQVEQKIDRTVLMTGMIVLALLVTLVLLLGLIQFNLFNNHVKRPMEKVRKRLLSIQQGDYSSPMILDRSDEWEQIETVFNNMLDDLVESWSAVQESERRYRNIFESASFGIFQSTPEGVLLNVNPALAIMYGADVYGDMPAIDDLGAMVYVNPQDRSRMVERLLREETISGYEVELRRLDGETFWASITCHVVIGADDKVRLIEGTIEDITKRRQAEDELHRLKEYLHDIVDTMPSILIGVDDRLKVSLWNQQVADLSGVPVLQAFEQPLAEVFELIDPDDYLAVVRETLKTKEIIRLRKIPGTKAADGHFFDLLIYPLTTPDATGVVIHMDDVTEKAKIEEVLVQSEKMLSVGSLAAGIAHEINNPLASILQNVQVLDQRLSPALKKNRQVAEQLGINIEQVAEYAQQRGFGQMIKSIADAGQRAARIIENMLNFSRKSTSNFLPCAVTELMEKTIELAASDYDMKHHFDFRAINLVRDYQPVPQVPCESSQIQQVILNLLKNAAQALGSKPENPEIKVRIFLQEDQVCLQIEDNGDGMDDETRRRIFEPFFTTKDVGYGPGLGLSVSYFLITENHKGSLTVTSKPGEGTCFSIFLPIKR